MKTRLFEILFAALFLMLAACAAPPVDSAFQSTEDIATTETVMPENAVAIDAESQVLYTVQLTNNDDVQTIEIDTSHDDDGWYVLSVKSADGKTLWEAEAATAHSGWNTILLTHLHNRDYLMQYHPTTYQGYSTYTFHVFSLDSDGNEILLQDGSVDFTTNPPGGTSGDFRDNDIEAVKSFFEIVNDYLHASELVLTTDEHIKELLPEGRRDRTYGTKDEPITTRPLSDFFYETPDVSIEEQMDRFIEMYTREYGVAIPNSLDDEFQDFIETWKLTGLITDSFAMTMEDKRRFLSYFQQFDDAAFNYVMLLLQGIIAGTVTHDFDDHEYGVYLSHSGYCLYDMNQDGFSELILKTGVDSAGYWYTVYTIVNGELIDCGGLSGSHADLYANGFGSFIRYEAQMGIYDISEFTLEGTTLTTKEIASGELDYNKNENYPTLASYGYGDYNQPLEYIGIPGLMLAPKG